MKTTFTERLRRVEKQATDLLYQLPPNLLYHNAEHTLHPELGVASMANKLSLLEQISDQERELVVTAAYLHDIGYLTQPHKNEPIAAKIAGETLPAFGYTMPEVAYVQNLILATEVPTNPRNHLERILCDADVDNVGRDDFLDLNEALRKEIGANDQLDWYKRSIRFLEGHQFYTPSARALRDEGKQANLQKLYALVGGK